MTNKLDGKRIAVLATDGVEASELSEPVRAARDAGAQVDLVSLRSGQIQPESGDTKTPPVPVDAVVADVAPEAYDALILPGGTKNPDRLRMNRDAVDFVRGFWDAGKPIASICHGPWMLVEADVVHGLTLTSWPSLRTDVENAAAIGSTRRCTWITASSRAESPTICRPSARSSWKSSPKDVTIERAPRRRVHHDLHDALSRSFRSQFAVPITSD